MQRGVHPPRLNVMTTLALVALLAASPAAGASPAPPDEARISVDFKEADVLDIARLMAELGGFQLVAHPGISCRLTLKLTEVPLETAFDMAMKSCGLGYEESATIRRVAPVAQLRAEAEASRKLREEQALNRPLRTRLYRLSYAKAAELAPLIRKFLSPRGDVIFDARTNTLIITDIE